VGVLEYHQHRPAPGFDFELVQERLEHLLAFELRADVEICGGARQRQ